MRPLETSSAAKNHRLPNPLHPKCFYTLWANTCRWFLLPAVLCGSGFVVIKLFEYQEKAALGINFLTNDFFLFYYLITGMHFVHVLLGLPLLVYFAVVIREGKLDSKTIDNLESSAIFWHMVDLLWVVIFPLIYLVR